MYKCKTSHLPLRLAVGILACCLLLGCGTTRVKQALTLDKNALDSFTPYSSVGGDVIKSLDKASSSPQESLCYLLDLPVAIAVDTVFLPWDVLHFIWCEVRDRRQLAADIERERLEYPSAIMLTATLLFAKNNKGVVAHHLIDVLVEYGWSLDLLKDQRFSNKPLSHLGMYWWTKLDRPVREYPEKLDDADAQLENNSDFCFLGSNLSLSALSKSELETFIIMYARKPLKPRGYLVGYANNTGRWLTAHQLDAEIKHTLALREKLGLPMVLNVGREEMK